MPPDPTTPHAPRLLGHDAAVAQWQAARASGRMHHAWLLGGPEGIGKAALGWQMAYSLLRPAPGTVRPRAAERILTPTPDSAHEGADLFGGGLFDDLPPVVPARVAPAPVVPPTAAPPAEEEPELGSLTPPPGDPLFQRLLHGGHGDCQYLCPPEDKREIPVELVRKLGASLALTPSEGDWRVVLIDSVDQLNHNAANALLKLLEEPPPNVVMLLISHAPGGLLPTIRSRCRQLRLHPPGAALAAAIVRDHPLGQAASTEDCALALHLAADAPGKALAYLEADAPGMYRTLCQTVADGNATALLACAARIGGKGGTAQWVLFQDMVLQLLAHLARGTPPSTAPAAPEATTVLHRAATVPAHQWSRLYSDVRRTLDEAETYNLERRVTIYHVLSSISERLGQ